ncbi:MAG: hypothetical protein MI785_28700 [Kiloniellales bacterium]|nr:hypothetical protein [Kiloniellales bacterium]
MGGLIFIVGTFMIELVLMPIHRRRTGQELIEPLPPLPGQAAGLTGLFLIWPKTNRSGYVITIDKAPRFWRWIVISTTWAGLIFGVCLIIGLIVMPERYW